ncbi:hypothetical protein [Spirosoma utsteinense]|uniref:Uncharacterized protein n=1 Tax=Spirosoma utsteinense TaxID=2585773 RepID=A0ABR6W9I8_9BACT|nr:hypothetical protein [Spirosoma utsteinense]MBC3787637.1 hypothetical protein [Spirosoma utsteinense]MBC3793233.1 hypothetical protein [Spirosoma utsteinense]
MAHTDDIRRSFHQLIDMIEDDQSLVSLYAVAALYMDQQHLLLDTTDPHLLGRMQTSLEQAQRGEVISNESMKTQVRQWLGK